VKILLIEDDDNIVEAISLAVKMRWPDVVLLATHLGEHGVELAFSDAPDVVVLDLGLPDISGFEVLKRIRLHSSVPILILTVKSEETDIVKGLEWGADDYMVKPFRQMELLARIQTVTRRQASPGATEMLVCGPLRFDPATRQLFCNDRETSITATEARILHHLIVDPGHVATPSMLTRVVWGEDYDGAANSLRVHIRRLREKIEADPGQPRILCTKPGAGYFLARPDSAG